MAKKPTGAGRVTPPKPKEDHAELFITDFDSMMGAKVPVTDELRMCLDSVKAQRRDVALKERDAIQTRVQMTMVRAEAGQEVADLLAELEGKLVDAEAELEEASQEAASSTVVFALQAIGAVEMDDLMKGHAPTAEQQRDHQERKRRMGMPTNRDYLEYDPKTFPQALTSACTRSPAMTMAQADELWRSPKWSQGELASILAALWQVNQTVPS